MANIKKALILKKYTDFAMKVLIYYYKYLNIFLWKEVNKLAEHWLYNYKIVLKESKPKSNTNSIPNTNFIFNTKPEIK